jgi:hypothetical protein
LCILRLMTALLAVAFYNCHLRLDIPKLPIITDLVINFINSCILDFLRHWLDALLGFP